MKVDEFKNITYDLDNETGIVTVTINRPEIKNALTILVLLELYWATMSGAGCSSRTNMEEWLPRSAKRLAYHFLWPFPQVAIQLL